MNDDVELIIVIDGDNEPIHDALMNLKFRLMNIYKSHLTIRIIRVFQSRGVSYARNLVLKNANGKYVKFCDDDDLSVNVNELINVIKSSSNIDYIECCMTNLTKNKQCPLYTGWFPSNVIVKTSWIRLHKLYFVNDIVGEDSVWRFDLFHQLHLSGTAKIVERSIYLIYFKSFKTTNDDDDERYDKMMNNIFNHEVEVFGKIPMNPGLFEMISSLVHGKSHPMKVSDWMLRNPDKFEFGNILKDINRLHAEIDAESMFAPKCERISRIANEYYGFIPDDEILYKFTKRYMMMKDALTNKNNEFMRIYDSFMNAHTSPHYFRVYVHMMKKRDSCWMKPNHQNLRFAGQARPRT